MQLITKLIGLLIFSPLSFGILFCSDYSEILLFIAALIKQLSTIFKMIPKVIGIWLMSFMLLFFAVATLKLYHRRTGSETGE